MTGKQGLRKSWREERFVMPACLRSVHLYGGSNELAGSLSPAYGGPPG
ncbi:MULTISPECIES: hypothetical protein [Kribbella]